MEKFLECLQEADKIIRNSDHMIYVTLPIVNDKKLLLKIITQIKKAVTNCINAILQYEYLYKRIKLYKDPHLNFKTFKDKCSKKYNINKEEITLIIELFDVVKKHKESPFEFIKNNKIVILSENLQPKIVTIEKTKEFLALAKNLLQKTSNTIRENFDKI